MKILFISDNFPPEVNAPSNRIYEHSIEWIKRGHKVFVITSFPNFPIGKVFKGYKNQLYKYEKYNGIYVLRVWTYITENKGFLKRIIDYISFMITSIIFSYKIKDPDIVMATSPQFFAAISGLIISRLKRKPFILEIRDLWPESIKAVGAMKDNMVIKILEKIETFLYKKADIIVIAVKNFEEHIKNRNPQANIIYIPNGANLSKFYPKEKNKKLLNELNPDNKFLIGYIGTIGMAHDLDTILDIAKQRDDIQLLIIGEGANKQRIKNRIEKEKINNVKMLSLVPHDKIQEYWSVIDAALVPLKNNKLFKDAFPSKIPEAAAMGKPIILCVDGFAKKIIEEYNCGVFGGVEDKEMLNNSIDEVIKNKEILSKNSLKLAKDYSRENLANKLIEFIEKSL